MITHDSSAETRGDWTGNIVANGGGWLPPDGSGEFTAPLIALFLGINEDTVRRLVRAKEIPVRVIGGQIWVTPEAIRAACPAGPWEGRKPKKAK